MITIRLVFACMLLLACALHAICQVQERVLASSWDFRADISTTAVKETLEASTVAVGVASGQREREVLEAATRCASSIFKEMLVDGSPARAGRFRSATGDSWTFAWRNTGCPESSVCLVGLIDAPDETMFEVQLPYGGLNEVLDRSLRWSTDPIQLGNLHVYTKTNAPQGSTIALLGGVIGSEWAGGYGFRGVVETVDQRRTARILLGKRHCVSVYPKDLYFTSRRFIDLQAEAPRLGVAELVADVKRVLREHDYHFPTSELDILLKELSTRGIPAASVRDLLRAALWPLDGFSLFRIRPLLQEFFRDADTAKRNMSVLEQEMSTLLASHERTSIARLLPEIAASVFKYFGRRRDDVTIEAIALQFVSDPRFTESALKYLELKATSESVAELLRRKQVAPEFESARELTVNRISERVRIGGEKQ